MNNNGHMAAVQHKYCPECGGTHERYMSIATAAQVFDLTDDAIRSMIKRRELPFYKIGKRVRLSYSEIRSLLIRHPSADEMGLQLEVMK